LGQGTQRLWSVLREKVPYRDGDTWWAPEIEKIEQLVKNHQLVW